jgi:hypothetical protein
MSPVLVPISESESPSVVTVGASSAQAPPANSVMMKLDLSQEIERGVAIT